MPRYSPPKAYFYLRKQDRLRRFPAGTPPPAGTSYVTDANGNYVVNASGDYLTVPGG